MFYSLRLLETLKVIITLNSQLSSLNSQLPILNSQFSIKKTSLCKVQSNFAERSFCITTVYRRCFRR